MKAVIIGNGSISDYEHIKAAAFEGCSLIICCDGGASHARALGVTPGFIVGDLDSIDGETLKYYEQIGIPFEKYPTAKDSTDTEIALDKAVSAGAGEIVFIGVLGNRADHSLANIGLLYNCLKRGVNASVIDDNNKITLLDKKTVLDESPGQVISLLPFSEEVTGITTKGLLYPLKGESLKWGTSRGVSNVCLSARAEIDLKSGILLLITPVCL